VKRLGPSPLFQHLQPDVYCVDTSAWFNIDRRPDADDVWVLATALIQAGRIVACARVLAELRIDPIYLTRFKPYESALQIGDCAPDDISYLMRVGQITHDFPAMSKATSVRTPADPYVVALAQHYGYVVVTDDKKIRSACRKLAIRCLTLPEFVVTAGATMTP
jgi:predicted nucleic acid-binding protein